MADNIPINPLALLLEKPTETLLLPKGEEDVIFQMPQKFYNKKVRKFTDQIAETQKESLTVPVKNITISSPAIENAAKVDKTISLLIPKHMELAVGLIDEFLSAPTIEDLLSIAVYCRERINPFLFNYALTVALLHRPDTKDVRIPNVVTTFPGKFIDASHITDVRRMPNLAPVVTEREPIVIKKNFTASNREPEQAMAYFREDVGINLHYWYWHLVYPSRGGKKIVEKDRRGELFYYMHQQILARYNAERLCNNMGFVKSLDNLRASIEEGYFPKLNSLNSNRAWPPRFMYSFLRNIDRPSDRLNIKIDTVEEWVKNIEKAIQNNAVENTDGVKVPLDEKTGINILGDLIEASDLSLNKKLYGNLFNTGNILIAFCHDPEEKYLEEFGVVGDNATAMRDPVFYRWMSRVNKLFLSHKMLLSPYSKEELEFPDVVVNDVYVEAVGVPVNEIRTFWETSTIDLSRGLDFVPKGKLPVTLTYLQHMDYNYKITVENKTQSEVIGTVRIFMAPKYEQRKNQFSFEEQRQLMIEMDRFTVTLNKGSNVFQRSSYDSSVTIEYEKTFKNADTSSMNSSAFEEHNFCGCGWPDHMLVPKGTTGGFKMDLFVMVSDYKVDKVNQSSTNVCVGGDSYCGIFSGKYPDSRSMGFPFDRQAEADNLSNFLVPNMKTAEITIKYQDKTVQRPKTVVPTVSPAVRL